MSFGHFWLTQLPDVRTIHSSRCTLIWAAGTSKFTLGLAFHNLPMGLSAWFNNGGIISSTFTYFYDEVWLMKIDEVWWNMMKYANIFRCCILPTVPRYIQEISKNNIEHFFWEKSDSLAAISGELDTRTTHPIECACIIWSRLRCYFSCPPEGKLRGVQCLSLFACGIYKIMLTQIWYIILSYDIIIYNHI